MVSPTRVRTPVWFVALGCAAVCVREAMSHEVVSLPDPNPTPGSVLADSLLLHPRWVIAGDRFRRRSTPTGPSSTGGVLLWPRSLSGVASVPAIDFATYGIKRSDRYGESTALAGDLLFVGAPGSDQSVGKVHVVDLSGAVPDPKALIVPDDSPVGQEFGAALAADTSNGAILLTVGSPGYAGGSAGSRGRVELFVDGAGGWSSVGAITGAVVDLNSRFATALGVNATHIAVGAPGGGEVSPFWWGRVFLYDRSNPAAAPLVLTAPVPVIDDHFGAALAMGRDLLLVGAPASECGVGKVEVFRLARGRWTHEATLAAPDAEGAGWYGFGGSVALDRERVVVGSGATVRDAALGQRAAVFRRAGDAWVVEAILDGADDGPSDAAAAGLVAIDPAGSVITQPLGGAARHGAIRFDALPRSADLDFDGIVGAPDLAFVLGAWGVTGVVPEDVSGDGHVDATDLAILIGEWSVRP